MAKGWLVTWVSIFAIVAIGFYVELFPYLQIDKKVTTADIVAGISAIATAIAAYAAWEAASVSRKSAEESKYLTRAQLYVSHRKDFIELLDYVAAELKVVFFRKYELYMKLFPENHYSGEVFEPDANIDAIKNWVAKYEELSSITKGAPSDLELEFWIMECSTLAEQMHFVFPRSEEPQLYLHASELPIQTQFEISPARPVFYLGEVMNHLRAFGGYTRITPLLLADQPFEVYFARYFTRIAKGHPTHRVCRPKDWAASAT
ncbi:hypothetical protein SAMN04487857_102377 [Pseudomonas sp. ok272]|uniref:hypothetical protein n=1 Tax=unclassified Pseudomonas TaxID=196821 RepID=UPI0008BB3969|nr:MULTISPECIES: hypothetical protein [unclassified Pseudomonas]SEM51258.1 hypothetical protein SAMN04487857_102377 [Pseudomonas sp. ok272]SFM22961.1 hypothetical protein SAMN04487858_101378 [Pseudomonas sp. ok602]